MPELTEIGFSVGYITKRIFNRCISGGIPLEPMIDTWDSPNEQLGQTLAEDRLNI